MADETETKEFLDLATEAALQAGKLIRDNWLKPKNIDYKSAIDLVTDVDRAAERIIVDAIQRRYPDHSILAEEETRIEQRRTGYHWIIDPLDGTTNFAHSFPQFCVSIALQQNGATILGLVYDPIRDERFQARRGAGATLNGDAIHCSQVDDLDKALLATGFPYDHRERADYYLSYFRAFMTRCQGIRRAGSAALDLCYLACGRIDGFWELNLKAWDTAAGTLIVSEAGGELSDFRGGEFSPWGNEILAANPFLHGAMVAITAQVTDQFASRAGIEPRS